MARILITDGGCLGSYVMRDLQSRGHDVTILDRADCPPLHSRYPLLDRGNRVLRQEMRAGGQAAGVDLQDRDALRAIIRQVNPEYVVHLGDADLDSESVRRQPEQAFGSIVIATQNLLEVLRQRHSIRNLVFVSCAEVYSDSVHDCLGEDSRKSSQDLLAGLILACEGMCTAYSGSYSLYSTIVRPGVIYGPGETRLGTISRLLATAMRQVSIPVPPQQGARLDYTHVEDLAAGVVTAMFSEHAVGRTFNLGTGVGYTLAEVTDLIRQRYSHCVTRRMDVRVDRRCRPPLDIRKAEQVLNYQPCHTLSTGLHRYAEFVEQAMSALPRRRAA